VFTRFCKVELAAGTAAEAEAEMRAGLAALTMMGWTRVKWYSRKGKALWVGERAYGRWKIRRTKEYAAWLSKMRFPEND
jgi:hypothetical protein